MNGLKKSVEYKNGSALVIDALEACGLDVIFGYPGASILSIYNELADRNNIFHCLCRHEQACVHASEGYARISGKVGVVLVTSGPGVTNTVTGIADAYADCTPLLVIAGTPAKSEGKVFQDVDFVTMIKNSVKKVFTPAEDDNLFDVVKEAILLANSGKKGPVVLQLTRDVLDKKYPVENATEELSAVFTSKTLLKEKVADIASLISKAEKPLFLVGGGCAEAFDKVSALALSLGIDTVSTLMGVGNVASCIPVYKGMIGVNGVEGANNVLFESDLIVAFGVAFSDRTTCKSEMFANGVPIVNVNIEKYLCSNVNIVAELNYNCTDVLEELLTVFKCNTLSISDVPERRASSQMMGTQAVLDCINAYTRKLSPIVITDVGQHQMFAAQKFDFIKPKRFLTSGGLGTMGFGLPASCGAHFAEPDACIINITGDGSFQMNIQELATVREYQIPVKIFIMNNGYLGMIRQTQEKLFGGKYYQSKMNNPDFITLAKGYDIQGYRVTSLSELKAVLPNIFETNTPIIVDCIIDEFESV